MDRPAERGAKRMARVSRHDRALWPSVGCLVGAVAAVSLVWLVDLQVDSDRRQRFIEQGREDVRQAVNQLAVEWEARLALIGALHDQARAALRAPPDSPARANALAELRATVARRGAGIDVVSAVSPTGNVLFTTGTLPDPRPDFTGRHYFKAIFLEHQLRFVGAPAIGMVSGRPDIPFAEAMLDTDDRVSALTVVSVPVGLLQSMRRYFDNPGVSMVALLRDDGVVLAREPMRPEREQIPLVGTVLGSARDTGFAMTSKISSIDGVMRICAVRRIEGTGLFVAAGIDEAVVLAMARLEQTQTDRWAVALTAASLLMAAGVAVVWRGRRRAARRQARMLARLAHLDLLDQIVGEATDMIALLDARLHYVYCNEAYRGLTGRDPAELIGQPVAPQMVAEDRPRIGEALAAGAAGARSYRMTFRVRRPDGTLWWHESEAVRLTADPADPGAPHYLVITRDVTERKQAEAELAETQEHVRTLLQMGNGYIAKITVGFDGARRSVHLSTLTPEAVQRQFPGNIETDAQNVSQILPEDEPIVRAAVLRCLDEGHATVEFRYRDFAGAVHWRRVQGVLLERRDDSFDLAVYATDISAEREARQRLQLSERLATLGEVATHLAHEISQPVTTIALDAEIGSLVLDESRPDLPVARDALLRIRRQTDRIGAIIHHIRQFGRAEEAGRESFEMQDVLAATELLVLSKLRKAGVTLRHGDMSGIGRLSLPRIPLEQVLMNLLSNASDAYAARPQIPPEQRVVTITARRDEDRLSLFVADQAGGIPEPELERVFEPFFTTKAPGEGTGVGLAICRSIVVDLGGTISVRNAGGGAVFDIEVPLEKY